MFMKNCDMNLFKKLIDWRELCSVFKSCKARAVARDINFTWNIYFYIQCQNIVIVDDICWTIYVYILVTLCTSDAAHVKNNLQKKMKTLVPAY